jgi:hypothetical protein
VQVEADARPSCARGTAFGPPTRSTSRRAIDEGADVFITGDAALARCTEIAVDVLTPTP